MSVTDQPVSLQYFRSNQLALNLPLNLWTNFESALDQSVILTITDNKGVILYANQKFCEISQYSQEELLGNTHRIINSRYHPKSFFRQMWETISKGEIWQGEVCNKAKDNSYYWVDTTIIPYLDTSDFSRYYIGIRYEITRLKNLQQTLQREKALLNTVLESGSRLVIMTTVDGNIIYVNKAMTEFLDTQIDEMIGSSIDTHFRLFEPDNLLSMDVYNLLSMPSQPKFKERELAKNCILFTANQKQVYVKGVIKFFEQTTNGEQGIVYLLDDISETYELNFKLRESKDYDSLTCLYNRSFLTCHLKNLLASFNQAQLKTCYLLAYVNINEFKMLNELLGHEAGDELLRQVSRLIQSNLAQEDLVARIGNDEFAIILPRKTFEIALKAIKDLEKRLKKFRFFWGTNKYPVPVRFGVIDLTANFLSLSSSEVLGIAACCCEVAKGSKGTPIYIYQPQDSQINYLKQEREIIIQIREAIEQKRFVLYQQGIVPIQPNLSPKVEILVRMLSPEGEIIPPINFIPVAEKYELMSQIDELVIQKLLTYLSQQDTQSTTCQYFVNLSGQTLNQATFYPFLSQLIQKFPLEWNSIGFEITETAMVQNFQQTQKLIESLTDRGFEFSLDDFGTGMSSFAYLKHFPVHYLKIDGCFIQDIVENELHHAIVESCVKMAKLLGIQTIAEYVENDVIRQHLYNMNVDYVQGFGVSSVEPLEVLT